MQLFKNNPTIWLHDAERSTAVDNWTHAVKGGARYIWQANPLNPFGKLYETIFPTELGQAVAMVDVNKAWTHNHPAGQRYHFQRAPGEGHYQGYLNAIGFLHYHTERWVNLARDVVARKGKPVHQATQAETLAFQVELALALHCLQDSFSTGHTLRSLGPAAPDIIRMTGTFDMAPPIRELTAYVEQDHAKHGDDDYTSGGLAAGTGRLAVEASAELILIGLNSIARLSGLIGWDAFVKKWVAEKIDRNAAVQPAPPPPPSAWERNLRDGMSQMERRGKI